MAEAKTFFVDVTIERTFKVTVGGTNGSIRLDGEDDEDAAKSIVHDYGHLTEAMMPDYIKIESAEMTVETVREAVKGHIAR